MYMKRRVGWSAASELAGIGGWFFTGTARQGNESAEKARKYAKAWADQLRLVDSAQVIMVEELGEQTGRRHYHAIVVPGPDTVLAYRDLQWGLGHWKANKIDEQATAAVLYVAKYVGKTPNTWYILPKDGRFARIFRANPLLQCAVMLVPRHVAACMSFAGITPRASWLWKLDRNNPPNEVLTAEQNSRLSSWKAASTEDALYASTVLDISKEIAATESRLGVEPTRGYGVAIRGRLAANGAAGVLAQARGRFADGDPPA